ncbi:MAG: glycine cleavage system protein GcvH [Candidatus Thermoplasmatota archaeon]|jgi:glycine cleavage system H protein|nr:glycine cleavage system protein GcvH [Candidatus Thermoplasmatota archaeon]
MAEQVPEKLLYTASHEWVKVEGKTLTVGITDHAQAELTDIVFVELPKVGMKLEEGKVAGVLESVKTVADIFAPAAGTISSVNESLKTKPELVNKEPYGGGWIFTLEADQVPATLLSADKYKSLTAPK